MGSDATGSRATRSGAADPGATGAGTPPSIGTGPQAAGSRQHANRIQWVIGRCSSSSLAVAAGTPLESQA